MVEMEEVAHILRNITPRSLILLDEIGRGTSTFDGLSIAWAVTEYLHEESPWRPKTLFATHYHELTELALTRPRIKNFHVAVKEWNDRVIFLRKLVEGGTSRSYGIQVARLAGLPPEVIARQTLEALRGRVEDEALVRQVSQAIRHYVVAAFSLEQEEPTTEELAVALDRARRVARDRPLVVGQPSRLPPGASRPPTSTGETPSPAGGTPTPLPAAGGALAPLHSSSAEPGAAMGLGHLTSDLVAALGDFLRECDARKFAPVQPPANPGLVSRALDLVARCEAERQPAAVPPQAQPAPTAP